MALAVLVGFVGLLRPSELFNLEVGDVVFPPRGAARCVLILRSSKSGRRNACEEKVLLHEQRVVQGLKFLTRDRPRGDRPFPFSQAQFVEALRGACHELGVPAAEVSGYSLRRGGATWNFLMHGSLARTAVLGRWASERTARIYIDGAMAQQARWRLSPAALAACEAGEAYAAAWLQAAGQ